MTLQIDHILWMTLKGVAIVLFFLLIVAISVFVERKIQALLRRKRGPSGIGQIFSDVLKLFFKEDTAVSKGAFFRYTPPIAFVLTLTPLGAIYFFDPLGQESSLDIFFVLATLYLCPLGLLMAGWASENSFLGVIRYGLQITATRLSMFLSVITIVLIYGTGSMSLIVTEQNKELWWFLPSYGILLQPLAAVVFFIGIFMETGNSPFDLTREFSTNELSWKYSSMRYVLLKTAEKIHVIILMIFFSVLFLGGYNILPGFTFIQTDILWISYLLQILSLIIKASVVFLLFTWISYSLPRYRFDQVISIGWKKLMPLSLFNLVATVIILHLGGYS